MTMAASLPCLVFDHGDDQRTTTLYSVSDGARRPCEEMDELLRGKRSWVTSHGWLLIWDPATLATFLWNPCCTAFDKGNNNNIALQTWASPPSSGTGCALSASPTDPAAGFTVVVLESSVDTALWYCHVAGGTSSPWARYEYDVGGSWLPWDKEVFAKRYVPGFAACRGKFYCDVSSSTGEYGVLEFSPEPALTMVEMIEPIGVADPPGEDYTHPFNYILNLDGELHTARIVFSGSDAKAEDVVEFAVYRVDIASKRCVRVDSIGDRAILAGGSNNCDFAGWCPATEYGLLPNSVYWVHPYDGRLHVYDVGANTEEVRELGEGAGREPSRQPFWILPPQT